MRDAQTSAGRFRCRHARRPRSPSPPQSAQRALLALHKSFVQQARWLGDRMLRHGLSPPPHAMPGQGRGPPAEAAPSDVPLDRRVVHAELQSFVQRVDRDLGAARRGVQSQLLELSSALPPPLAVRSDQTGLTQAQQRWLQECCAVLFPRCLVCLYDAQAQDDVSWRVISPDPDAAAVMIAAGGGDEGRAMTDEAHAEQMWFGWEPPEPYDEPED